MHTVTARPNIESVDKNLILLPQTSQLRALHTLMRSQTTPRSDVVFYSQRVIRLLLETGLNLLPFDSIEVKTPNGSVYHGLRFCSNLCGVSILRAGESIESGLREICRSIKIGKILMQRDKVTKRPHLYYAHLPYDIAERHVLLLDPMLATGGTAVSAIQLLIDKGVPEDKIIFICLITVPEGISAIRSHFPRLKIVTSAIDKNLNKDAYMVPGIGDFGDRYFGTDRTNVLDVGDAAA